MGRSFLLTVFAVVAVSAACDPSTKVTPTSATPAPAASVSPSTAPNASPSGSPASTTIASKADALVGRWPGEGGAYLNVTKKGDKYTIEIATTAGPKTYDGTAKGDLIEFTRNGKTETIKAATGPETGMKGFEKETNCVVVIKGSEGFCKK